MTDQEQRTAVAALARHEDGTGAPPRDHVVAWWIAVRRLASRRRYDLLLAGVALAFAVLQVALMGFTYALEWDEAVYLSQMNPAVPDAAWGAHRAWGTPALSAPVALLDLPVTAVRLYFIALSSVGLFLAYRAWSGVENTVVVPIAAAIFGASYVAVYHGGQVMPNYYAALGAVAATAFFLRCRRGVDSRWPLIGLAVAVGFTALVRPTDSLWLAASLGVCWLAVPAWRRTAVGAALLAGLIAGWTPWIIEAFVRFGGPAARLHAASHSVGGGRVHLDLDTVVLYLRMSGAARMGCNGGGGAPCELDGPIGPGVAVWWLAVAGLMTVGLLGSWHRLSWAAVVPFIVAAGLAFSYLFIIRYGYLRFLLPAGGIAAIMVARGLTLASRLRRPTLRRLGAGTAAALVIAHGAVQARILHRAAPTYLASRHAYTVLIQGLRDVGIGPPCLLIGQSGPTIAYDIACESARIFPDYLAEEPSPSATARAQGRSLAVISRETPPAGSYLDSWRLVLMPVPGRSPWRVYLPPEQPAGPGHRRGS
jgi:hypothetical protein